MSAAKGRETRYATGVRQVTEALLHVLASGQRAALATVIRVSGSTPQRTGARLLLLPDGSRVGTVGGGAIEEAVVAALRQTQQSGEAQVLTRALGYDLGMCCGGRMDVFVEPIAGRPRLIIFGAGHVAKPTAALAQSVGFDVVVVDEREELATEERFPDCQLVVSDPESYLRRTQLHEQDWLLIVTHDHQLDERLLGLSFAKPARYIGMIGSQRKVHRLLTRCAEKGYAVDLDRVFAPVGVDLGAVGPEEIAVSIAAELVALRRGRTVSHMRAAQEPSLRRALGRKKPCAGDIEQHPQLDALTARVRSDLDCIDYPKRDWLTPRSTRAGAHVYDVIIVGAGQGGLASAFALQRERVHNLLVLDENPLDRAGPWLSFARMRTLRTPKYLTGPDLGIPNLTFRRWYEAQHGADGWQNLGLIPKQSWAAYLCWYRRTLQLPVQPDTRVGALHWEPAEQAFAVPCNRHDAQHTLYARRVVLATGIDGSGRWHVPDFISSALPPECYAHTRDAIDFAALRGKRIAVLGAGASAFDNAACALEHGAAEVRLYFRRSELVSVNPYRWAEFTGFLQHLGELCDHDKWRFISQIVRMGQLPPRDTLQRAQAHTGFHLHPASAWHKLERRASAIVIHTASGVFEADYVIVATGFITDLRARPELALLEPHIARWSDRFTPPPGESHEDLLRHPYLGPAFEMTERTPGAAPELQYLYNYTFGGLLSLGFGGASISGMKYSIPRLVFGITRSLFCDDSEQHFQSLCSFDEREF